MLHEDNETEVAFESDSILGLKGQVEEGNLQLCRRLPNSNKPSVRLTIHALRILAEGADILYSRGWPAGSTIRSANLSGNILLGMKDGGVEAMGLILRILKKIAPRCHELKMNNCMLNDEGINVLVGDLFSHKHLTHICVLHNQISHSGRDALLRMWRNTRKGRRLFKSAQEETGVAVTVADQMLSYLQSGLQKCCCGCLNAVSPFSSESYM